MGRGSILRLVPEQSFRTLFCEQFGCPPEEFEERVLQECLYPRARLVAPLVRRVWPDFFEEDLKLIKYLGRAKSVKEAIAELRDFRDANKVSGGFLRTRLKIRVSGRNATRLALEIFPEDE
jgi:hypothetical protein